MMYDFRCPRTATLFERYTASHESTAMCKCGTLAPKVLSATRAQLDPISGDFKKATTKWAKQRQQHIGIERKNMANHGTHT